MSDSIKKRNNSILNKILLGGTLLAALLRGDICISAFASFINDAKNRNA